MGLYLKQENDQTELQRRIKSELRRKSEASSQVDVWSEDEKTPDEVVVESQPSSQTGKFIFLVAIALIIIIGYLAVA